MKSKVWFAVPALILLVLVSCQANSETKPAPTVFTGKVVGITDGDAVEVKLNGVLLPAPTARQGWQVFKTTPRQFAVGRNLVSMRIGQRAAESPKPVRIEKLEVHVAYNR